MRIYKIFFSVLAALIIFSTANSVSAETSANALIAKIERDTYGSEQVGAMLPRLSKLEKDYSGQNLQEDMNTRIDALYNIIYDNSATPGLLAKINALEWNLDHEVKSGGIESRIEYLEEAMLGETNEGTFISRIRELTKASFGSENIPMNEIQLPADTVIKIALVDSVGSREAQVGDLVKIKIVEDVIIGDELVFAKGLYGTGIVETVKRPDGWGSNGKLTINFQKITCIDGQEVDIYSGYASQDLMIANEMVYGAALVGINLKSEWERFMVHGKNLEVPADTELYIQTKNDTSVYALKGGRGSLTIKTGGSEETYDDFDTLTDETLTESTADDITVDEYEKISTDNE